MQTEKTWIKTLCNAFKLPEAEWLPPAVTDMLSYLLAAPARFLEGDILYIRAEEQVTSAQLLTILLNKGEIIAEKPVIMQNSASSLAEDVSCFWQEQLIPYAAEYGLYKDGVWNLDQILLKAADDDIDLIKSIIDQAKIPVSVIPAINQLEISNKLPAGYHARQVFNSVLIIYPKHFYIEKKPAISDQPSLELIPFASENLVLNINQRCKIFSFPADSEYNLADDKNFLRCKIYEQDYIDRKPSISADPYLSMEHNSQLQDTDMVVEIYLNLSSNCLEVDIVIPDATSPGREDVLQDWKEQQQIGYDLINHLPFIEPRLIADYGQYLKAAEPLSDQNISKAVYFRAVTLLNILCSKK